jgi:acylphosphatase
LIARRLRVVGRVQGVGYRDAMCDVASGRDVRGWVRNLRDGSVDAWVQGDERAVAEVIAWARRGPPLARVDRVDVAEVDADAGLRVFSRASTA